MNEPAVSVRNLTKSFSGRRVVDDLSFDVQKGEVFAMLGHNGAGKSTTIDLILGLKAPERGSAKILGMDAAKNRKQVFERVGVQLQNTRYQFNITVEERRKRGGFVMNQDKIVIRGLRQNNLKNVSLDIPKGKIVVFTGVSGSGKSSIVFDTIAAESQRQMAVHGKLPHRHDIHLR